MKVNPGIEDAFIPMEAADFLALQEQRRKRNEHWARMYRAREQFMDDVSRADCSSTFEFWEYLKVNYGLLPDRDPEGNITDSYTVTDEKLYTLFLLKFGQ
jgi:hypothetical protein